jgi:hypothetical protein
VFTVKKAVKNRDFKEERIIIDSGCKGAHIVTDERFLSNNYIILLNKVNASLYSRYYW